MDWPISWQKVKDSSGNTGGGSGSGFPVIDLSKYVLPEGSGSTAVITDPTDLAALAELNGMPFIGKFAQTRNIGTDTPFTNTYTMVMNYANDFDFVGYAGNIFPIVIQIMNAGGYMTIMIGVLGSN